MGAVPTTGFFLCSNGEYTVTATLGNGNAGISESIDVSIEQGNDVTQTITFGDVNDQTPLELVE